jgi:hypothetical protein
VEVFRDISGFDDRAISIEIPSTFTMGAAVYPKQLLHTPQNKAGRNRNGKKLLCAR